MAKAKKPEPTITSSDSSAPAHKALALMYVDLQFGFAVPAVNRDPRSFGVRQNPHQPPVSPADRALQPPIDHRQFISFLLRCQHFRLALSLD